MTKTKKNAGNRDWRQELQRLLDKHNGMPSLNGKIVNHNTQLPSYVPSEAPQGYGYVLCRSTTASGVLCSSLL
jgi:hypothetical protein